jgi:ABC-type polysaccharide/polyol phosphate transport system ATPase subunit
MAIGVRLGEEPNTMAERMEDIQEFSGLGRRFDHPVFTYSSGMQVRLRFTAITSIKADVLLVDEGIGAADSEFNERASSRLSEFYANTGTLILASHAKEVLATHCAHLLTLNGGRLKSPSSDRNF